MRAQRTGKLRWTGIRDAVLLGMVLAVGLCATSMRAAQRTGQSGPPTPPLATDPMLPPVPNSSPGGLSPLDPSSTGMDPGVRAHMEAERLKAANDDRHKKLVMDVDKLVSLTNELKTDVDKTNKDELSLDVIRKAQEIEKLAHDVQSRMKN